MPAPDNPYAGGMGNPHRLSANPEQQYTEYAVPGVEQTGPYTKEYGWGPHLGVSPTGTPDAERLMTIPRYDRRPDPTRAPESFWRPIDADKQQRSAVEDQNAVGWGEQKVLPGDSDPGIATYKRWAPNPRTTPPPESRKTQQMSPANYSFTRPFDQFNRNYFGQLIGSARTFNGFHFSMADHRREYPILGMAPVKQWRNTYRMEPTPWDTNIVDMPPNNTEVVSARVTSSEVPYTTRSFRL